MISRPIFQKLLLAFIFLFPYSILHILGCGDNILGIIGLYLIPFLLIAIIVSEATRNVTPGKEDYVLIPLLLLYVFPFDLSLFKMITFAVLGLASFFLLTGKR
jgi:hypothetical protein